MIAISIILPCYNVAQYIERSLNSILQQDFSNYEIIIINDGSTDNLLEICSKYQEYSNISIYTFKNQGLSQARNEGLLLATGEYVYFFDPDDYINPGMLSAVYNKAKEGDYDAVHFGFKTIYEDQGGIHYDTAEKPYVYKGNEIIRKQYMPKFLGTTQDDINTWIDANYLWKERKQFSSVWRFLYKRSVLIDNQVFFYKGVKLFEDKLFNACFFCYAQSLATMNEILYNYFIREKGLLSSSLSNHEALVNDKINGIIQRNKVRELYKKVHNEDIFNCYIGTIVFSALELIIKLTDLPLSKTWILYKKYIALGDVKNAIHTIQIHQLPLKLKIPIYLLKLNFDWLLIFIVRVIKIIRLKINI